MNPTSPVRYCSNLYAFLGLKCETNKELSNTAESGVKQSEIRCSSEGKPEIVITTAPRPDDMTKMLNIEKARAVENFLASTTEAVGKLLILNNDSEDFDFGFESPPELVQEDGEPIDTELFVNDDRLPIPSSHSDSGQSMDSDTLHESDEEPTLFYESLRGSPELLIPDLVAPEESGIDCPSCVIYSGNVTGDDCTSPLERTNGPSSYYYVRRDIPAKVYHFGEDERSEMQNCVGDKDENICQELCISSREKLEELQDAMQNLKILFEVKCSKVDHDFEDSSNNLTDHDLSVPELRGPNPDRKPDDEYISCDDSGIAGDDDRNSMSDASDDESRQRVRRSSSLRTWKTPPGTPSRKKIVRFADAMGLDLADVRTFLDGVPNVPKSAYQDLAVKLDGSEENLAVAGTLVHEEPQRLIANFPLPGTLPDFIEKVKNRRVCLESAVIESAFTLKGVIRLLNLGYYKSVLLRCTLNEWKTFHDVPATYITDSCDGLTDKFEFSVPLPQMKSGDRVVFAICYRVSGQEFWDNNNGFNYSFTCVSSYLSPVCPVISPPVLEKPWIGFLD